MNPSNKSRLPLIALLAGMTALLSLLLSCNKDAFITDKSAKLGFSTDTLRFDTVFTQVGSATYSLKVYNTHSQRIRIDRIYIESGGRKSFFTLNVDGIPGNSQSNVEIPANDSIYVFARVTIDPNQPPTASPYVINENLVFETNGNRQEVALEAWGQNANYIPYLYGRGTISRLSAGLAEVVWNDPKPYVLYGILLIDSCTLTIPAGARIHVHGGIAKNPAIGGVYNEGILYVQPAAKLNIRGTLNKPVVFEGDRLEEDFKDVAGQWAGIILGAGSRGNVVEYATIRNSIVGIRVDSAADLTIRNSRIYNTAGNGILAQHASITAEQCLFYNNFSDAVRFAYGGNYNFTYCTLASYGVDAIALNMSNTICYDQFCNKFDTYPLQALFTNCIIFGSRRDEISLFNIKRQIAPQELAFTFRNCIFRVDELVTKDKYTEILDPAKNPGCINGKSTDKLFRDANKDDYHPDTLSIAQSKALLLPGFPIDLDGNPRDGQPDVGCFEFKPR